MAVPSRQAFGVRPLAPPPFAPRQPEPALGTRVKRWLDRLKSDWIELSAETLQGSRVLTARLGAAITRAHAPRRDGPPETAAHLTPQASEARETLVRFLAYAGGIGALSFFAAHLLQAPSLSAAVEPTPRPDWLTVAKPYPAFQLTQPEFGEEGHYVIQRHTDGGGRKDILTFGEPGRSLRYGMVEIYRPGRELDQFTSPASEIAARARELGPASAVRASLPVDSKFGPISIVEFTVGRFGVGHCIGFVRADDEPRLQISGIACSMNTLVDRGAVACMLDRLTLISAGSDPDIAKYFAHAEIKRNFCGHRDPLLYATPKRDYPATPLVNLRGRMSSR